MTAEAERGVQVSTAGRRRGPMLRETALLTVLPVLISCVMLWPALLGMGVLAPTDIVVDEPFIGDIQPGVAPPIPVNPMMGDVVDQVLPWRLYARSELRAGRIPLWNPYNVLGTPLLANYQSAVFSPFNVLWLLLPAIWGLGAVAALKWAALGFGMALLLRRLGLGLLPSAFGGAAVQLMAPMAAWLQWPLGESLVWPPWMLLATLGWVDTRRPLWLAVLSAFTAAEMLAGHVETAFYSFALVGAFAAAAVLSIPVPFKAKIGMLGATAGAGALGVAISAAQLLPFLGILPSSWQWVLRQQESVNLIPMDPKAALTLLTPNGFGWPDAYYGPFNWLEAGGYVGSLTLLLAAWGLAAWFTGRRTGPATTLRRRMGPALSPREPLFWALLVATALSMTYGIPPLSLIRALPGFSSSFNFRLISLADMGLAVLGAMGLHHLLTFRGRFLPRPWVGVAAALGAVGLYFLVGGLGVWTVSSQDVAAYTRSWKMWAGALFCVGAAIILLNRTGLLKPRVFAALAIGLLLLDMGRVDWNLNPTSAFNTFYPSNALTDFLASRGITERAAIEGSYAETNRLMAYRLPDYRYYDPTIDNRYRVYTRIMSPVTFNTPDVAYRIHLLLDKPKAPFLSLVGIKWLVTTANLDPNQWQPVPERGPIYRAWLQHNNFVVWENRYAKPYAYLASRLKTVPGEAEARESVKEFTLETINEAIVEDPTAGLPQEVASASNDQPLTKEETQSIQIKANIPGTIEVKLTAEKTRFLVVNEGWSDGWRASVDGKSTPLYRTNYIAQGLVVPPGRHTVALTYDPPLFKLGLAVSGAALLVWTALLIFALRHSRRRARGTG